MFCFGTFNPVSASVQQHALAVAFCRNPVFADTVIDDVLNRRVGSALRQPLVVLVVATAIRMRAQLDPDRRIVG